MRPGDESPGPRRRCCLPSSFAVACPASFAKLWPGISPGARRSPYRPAAAARRSVTPRGWGSRVSLVPEIRPEAPHLLPGSCVMSRGRCCHAGRGPPYQASMMCRAIDTGPGRPRFCSVTAASRSARLYQCASVSSSWSTAMTSPGHGLGPEAHHQAARHRPGLAGHVPDVRHDDPGLFGHLADHGLLEGFARFHEPGQDRDAAARPAGVAGQQDPVLGIGDQHDHRRVGAREVLGAVDRAARRNARPGRAPWECRPAGSGCACRASWPGPPRG